MLFLGGRFQRNRDVKVKSERAVLSALGSLGKGRVVRTSRCSSSQGGIKMPGARLVAFQAMWEAGEMARQGQHSSGIGIGWGVRHYAYGVCYNGVRGQWGNQVSYLVCTVCTSLRVPKLDVVRVLTVCLLE